MKALDLSKNIILARDAENVPVLLIGLGNYVPGRLGLVMYRGDNGQALILLPLL